MIGRLVDREAVITPVEADAKKKASRTIHLCEYRMYCALLFRGTTSYNSSPLKVEINMAEDDDWLFIFF